MIVNGTDHRKLSSLSYKDNVLIIISSSPQGFISLKLSRNLSSASKTDTIMLLPFFRQVS